MNGTYRKEGATARVTSLRGALFESVARESGVAGYRGGRFFSASAEPRENTLDAEIGAARVLHDRIAAASDSGARIERLRAISGASSHRFEPAEGAPRSWTETLAVVHLTLLAPSGARASLLRGGASPDAIDSSEIAAVARALGAMNGRRRIPSQAPLVLSPAVSAELAAEIGRDLRLAPRIRVTQRSHPDFRVDGEGVPIAPLTPEQVAAAQWPNVFRPSYRSPAVSALMHGELAAREGGASSEGAIALVALLRPPHAVAGSISVEAVCWSEGETFAGAAQLSFERLARGTAEGPRTWYPFHAGAWGRRLRLDP